METLKVSGSSDPKSVAGAIAAVVRDEGKVELQAIGAAAINQTVKSIAISRGYVAPLGIDLIMIPEFIEIDVDDEVRTAIKFTVSPRRQ